MASDLSYAFLCATGWFSTSVLISIYNKWMFGEGLDFPFPLFVTAYHQLCLFTFSFLVILIFPKLRPSQPQNSENEKVLLIIPLYIMVAHILPCAVASAGDIGLSNASLMFIPLSLYTMVKTSSLLFVLIFGLLFRLEKFSWRLVVIVVVMCVSVSMMTMKPPAKGSVSGNSQHSLGVVLILLASAFLGLRWCFTQLLLKKSKYTTNPILTIFYLAPGMGIFLFIFALFLEGWVNFSSLPVWSDQGFVWTIALMTFPAVLAFVMTVSEFKLLTLIQILTLSIAGVAKELFTIAMSALIFGDTLSILNGVGLLITILNILWYHYHRWYENGNDINKNYSPISNDDFLSEGEEEIELHSR